MIDDSCIVLYSPKGVIMEEQLVWGFNQTFIIHADRKASYRFHPLLVEAAQS